MFGEMECLNDTFYWSTAICSSITATVYKIKKDDLVKILQMSDEALKNVIS